MKLRPDVYSDLFWRRVESTVLSNSELLSRSRQGYQDPSSSEAKRLPGVGRESLRRLAYENEREAFRYVRLAVEANWPADENAVRQLLECLARLVNRALSAGNLYRGWSTRGGYPANAPQLVDHGVLSRELDHFCRDVWHRHGATGADLEHLAAWAEWRLDPGDLHPFYDGCGRVARLFSGALLATGRLPPPAYTSRTLYYNEANKGPGSFAAYFRQCLATGRR